MRVIKWLRSWLALSWLGVRKSELHQRLDELEAAAWESRVLLAKRRDEVSTWLDQGTRLVDKIGEEIDAIERKTEQSQGALNEMRERLRICEDVTIPYLVTQHKLLLHRADADIAVQLRREVAMSPRQEGIT